MCSNYRVVLVYFWNIPLIWYESMFPCVIIQIRSWPKRDSG